MIHNHRSNRSYPSQVVLGVISFVAILLLAPGRALAQNSAWQVVIDIGSGKAAFTGVSFAPLIPNTKNCGFASDGSASPPDLHACQGDTIAWKVVRNGIAVQDPIAILASAAVFVGGAASDTDLLSSPNGAISATKINGNDTTVHYYVAIWDAYTATLYGSDPKILIGSASIEQQLAVLTQQLKALAAKAPQETAAINRLIDEVGKLEIELR